MSCWHTMTQKRQQASKLGASQLLVSQTSLEESMQHPNGINSNCKTDRTATEKNITEVHLLKTH
jgi:hypothetical protein